MEERRTRPLTAAELSLILGVSEVTIKRLARAAELPCRYERRAPVFMLDAVMERFRALEGGAL